MKIKIHSSELSRMMKVVLPCIDQHDLSNRANIEIHGENDTLIIRATNGVMSADVRTPYIWGDEESFCVDGQMFAKVVGACSGVVEISTDGKSCFIKGAGRTRLPIVDATIPYGKHIGMSDPGAVATIIKASDFIRCYNGVSYSVSSDQTSRPVLSGILVEVAGNSMRMTGLDGFQMSIEYASCESGTFSVIVPNAFMKLVSQSVVPDSELTLTVLENRITACTDDMSITCALLSGQYPDVKKIMPTEFKITCHTNGAELMNALKAGTVVNSKQNLVKLEISGDSIHITNNGDNADYEADVPCITDGLAMDTALSIAFNYKYLLNAISAACGDDTVLFFNSSLSPCVVQRRTVQGDHLVLPVRIAG